MRLGMSSEKKRNSDLIHLTGVGIFSSVFEIVFKKKAIGLKLGADTSKKHAVVKECIDGAEAKYHTDIRPGVYILAVNGDDVTGIGLSKALFRLREASRPVMVRFGTPQDNPVQIA